MQPPEAQLEQVHNDVRRYMPGVLPRLLMTYLVPVMLAMMSAGLVVGLLASLVPPLSARTFAFTAMLAILLFGWRWLENRNQATALLVLYTRYSNQRRAARTALANGETIDMRPVVQSATDFIDLAKAQGIDPQDAA